MTDKQAIDKLTVQRGTAKGVITRINNFVDSFSTADGDLQLLEVKLEKLESVWDKYESVQSELELIDPKGNHEKDRIETEDTVDKLKAKMRNFLKVKHTSSLKNETKISVSKSEASNSNYDCTLPQIKLQTFDGKYENWMTFSELFTNLIDKNVKLTTIQKFHYLHSAVTGPAQQLIQNLPITENNYSIAWESLKNRYENKRLIAAKHANDILSIQNIPKESANDLANFINTISSNINALKALSMNVGYAEVILLQFLEQRIDQTTIRAWESTVANDVFPSIEEFIKFLEKRRQILENSDPLGMLGYNSGKHNFKVNNQLHSHAVTTTNECVACKEPHFLYRCTQFLKMNIHNRMKLVKQHNLCFNCLGNDHMNLDCPSFNRCRYCNKLHHSLLHFNHRTHKLDKDNEEENSDVTVKKDDEVETSGSYCGFKAQKSKRILLSTALVKVSDINGRWHQCRALLDAGSQANFITESMAHSLQLNQQANKLSISGINNTSAKANASVDISLKSNYDDFSAEITCFILPTITGHIPSSKIDIRTWEKCKQLQLADKHFNMPGKIDLLIGAELYLYLIKEKQIKQGDNYPILQDTKLGWIVSGKLPSSEAELSITATSLCLNNEINIQRQLQKFWELEEVNVTPQSREDKAIEKHFVTHTRRDDTGRFIVRLPLRENHDQLGFSFKNAERRFLQMEKRLTANPELKINYTDFMKEYIDLGHMTLIREEDLPDNSKIFSDGNPPYYLPHHAVYKQSSTTTKTRVVFDASAKSSNGFSLNDILMVGPNIQQDIFSIITRFRTHIYALTADITKMYRQIRVDSMDQHLQRILWRESPSNKLEQYHLNTVTYGTASASFLATRCLMELAKENGERLPEAAKIISRDFYMDDLQTGGNDLETTKILQKQITDILEGAGLILHKWSSNHPELLESIPVEKREVSSNFKFDKEVIRTLGLIWDTTHDEFKFEINFSLKPNSITKRIVLSTIASIYDPLGILGPVVVSCKIFMQGLWQAQLDWDELLPDVLHQRWSAISEQLPLLSELKIPRLILVSGIQKTIHLHGFADASESAYGACVYIHSYNHQGHTASHLICSKSKVSPLKKQSIPRLELCAAVLLVNLVNKIIKIIDIEFDQVHLWTDSTVVLSWIASPPTRWKTFVANRVSTIQELSENMSWHHVSSSENPADLLSRGVVVSHLKKNELWWNGPKWLQRPFSYVANSFELVDAKSLPEQRCSNGQLLSLMMTKSSIQEPVEPRQNIETSLELASSYKCLHKMIRIYSYCMRFVSNAKSKSKNIGSLTVQEIDNTLKRFIRQTQLVYFKPEVDDLQNKRHLSKRSSILSLNPFIDKDGCLRVGGRLQQSKLEYDRKHQFILPSKAHLTKLIIEAEHLRLLHAGVQNLHASLRQRYWIINGKSVIRSIIYPCNKCFRYNISRSEQLMGELPKHRVQVSRPFLNCGVDYAGPFLIRQGGRRSRTNTKCYVALFICLASKAIHLELVSDLTSDSFIAALRRFSARRGLSANIYSDNGTSFVGANKTLRSLHNLLRNKDFKEKVMSHSSKEGIQWHFIPPNSPHFGGLWEAGVKSLKYHLRRILGSSTLNFEELTTVLTQVEACLNSRPLCQLSSDPTDPQPLTPGHFLIGSPITALPDPDFTQTPMNRLRRWQLVQKFVQHLWRKWSTDYLHNLQQRTKWKSTSPNIQPGTVVLLKEENLSPCHWKLARVVTVHPGPDGLIRVVTVRTSAGTFKRSITRLCPLPVHDN